MTRSCSRVCLPTRSVWLIDQAMTFAACQTEIQVQHDIIVVFLVQDAQRYRIGEGPQLLYSQNCCQLHALLCVDADITAFTTACCPSNSPCCALFYEDAAVTV